jgi:hypothetical protein
LQNCSLKDAAAVAAPEVAAAAPEAMVVRVVRVVRVAAVVDLVVPAVAVVPGAAEAEDRHRWCCLLDW